MEYNRMEWKIIQGFLKKSMKRLSFITQFIIEFLLPFIGCRKVIGKMPANRRQLPDLQLVHLNSNCQVSDCKVGLGRFVAGYFCGEFFYGKMASQ